jgi:Cupin-like domain
MTTALLTTAPMPNEAAYAPIDAGWRQWVAENRLRECTPESMLVTMTTAGLDPKASAQAIADMEQDPAYLAAVKHRQLSRKLESVLSNQQKLWESAPNYTQVEKRSGVSQQEFVERYVRGSRPLVLTDIASDWPALQRWSPADLKQRFGHLEVEIQSGRNADAQYEQNKLSHRSNARLGEFVDRVLAGGHTNDYYMTANNEVLRRPEFAPLLADIGSMPSFCDASQLDRLSSFWFGPAGTVTPLHHDTLMLFHTQIVGRKRWRFISPLETPKLYNHYAVFSPIDLDKPDLAKFPLFADVKVLDVTVEPGETVFLPLGWWHHVSSLDVCLSFSFSNLAVPNTFTYVNPSIHNW